jgi:hypothetical protein
MTSDPSERTYELVVRGELGDHFGVLFDGMGMQRRQGTTVLIGPLRDHAQLYGVIERIQELGIELVSVNRLDAPRPPEDPL